MTHTLFTLSPPSADSKEHEAQIEEQRQLRNYSPGRVLSPKAGRKPEEEQ